MKKLLLGAIIYISLLAVCLVSQSWGANELVVGTSNRLFFKGFEAVFDANGQYKAPGSLLAIGDHQVGIINVQDIDAIFTPTHWFSSSTDQITGIYAQRVEAILSPDPFDPQQTLPHIVLSPPTVTQFCKGGDCFSTAPLLAPGEMFALFRQTGQEITLFETDGPMADDVAKATDGAKWLSLSYTAGQDGQFSTIDDDGYFYSHVTLGVPLGNFTGEAWGALNVSVNNTGYSFCEVNDPFEQEKGDTTLLTDLYLNAEIQENPNSMTLGGSSPWDFQVNDPATMLPCEAPCVKIKKQVWDEFQQDWMDADTEDDAVGIVDGAKYRLVLTNCGATELFDVLVTDPELGVDYVIEHLPIGGEVFLTRVEIPELNQPGVCIPPETKENVATASVAGIPPVNDSAWIKCICIDIEKFVRAGTSGEFVDADLVSEAVAVIDTAEYKLSVTNCGSEDLAPVVINDSALGISNVDIGGLTVGETRLITAGTPGFENLLQWDRCDPLVDPPLTKGNTASAKGDYTVDIFDEDADDAWVVCTACTGKIGNYVWDDVNKNGLQDEGEPPLAGVTVNISGPDGYSDTTTTDAAGFYRFTDLCPGTYTVSVVTPDGYMPTPVCFNTQDVNGDANCSPQTVVSDNDTNDTIDFGFYKLMPAIDIEKHTNGFDADDPTGPKIPVDGMVTWEYIIENTGNVTLSLVVVTDDKLGIICTIPSMAPGAIETGTKTGTAMAGQYENFGTATGTYDGMTVDDTDPSHYFGVQAKVDVEKYVSTDGKTWYDADEPTGPKVPVCGDCCGDSLNCCGDSLNCCGDSLNCCGDSLDCCGDSLDCCDCSCNVYFKFVVTNDGDVELTSIDLTDNVYYVSGCPVPPSLDPGESFTCVIGPIKAEEGQHTDTATATGNFGGITYTDSDDANYHGYCDRDYCCGDHCGCDGGDRDHHDCCGDSHYDGRTATSGKHRR